jgi:hypothetical protein
MKKLILLIIFTLAFLAYVVISGQKADCYNCGTEPCYNSTNCDVNCWCYKSGYQYYGKCLPR